MVDWAFKSRIYYGLAMNLTALALNLVIDKLILGMGLDKMIWFL